MALPDQAPKLPKWPFLMGDAALLGAAWLIADRTTRPPTGEAVAAIVVCVAVAALAGVIPFLSDYARKQDEALDERQRSLEALARTVATAAEQIGIAAGGFQEIAALEQKNLQQAEQLSQRFQKEIPQLQARLDEFDLKIAALKSAAAKISAAPAPKSAKSSPPDPKPPAVSPAEPPAVSQIESPAVPPVEPPVVSPVEPEIKAVETAPPSEPVFDLPAAAPAPEPEPAAETPVAPKPPARKRAPKKPVAPAEPALPLVEPAQEASEFSQIMPEEVAEAAVSADGATRLLVTAYIGIGNRLFIRGEGPGLNWNKGIPLQFVSIGKWSWETPDASAPVKFKLYKNDEIECASVGSRQLAPGQQQVVTASF